MSNQFPQQPGQFQPTPYGVQPARSQDNTLRTVIIVIVVVFGLMLLLCGGLVFIALLLPAVGAARDAAQRASRANNQLKQIGLGIHNYHSAYNQLPHTVVVNSNGEELAGWRLGISPFVEGQQQWQTVTENYGPSSRSLVAKDAPKALQATDGQPGETHMFAIVSTESMFSPTPNHVVKFRDALDGLKNTALIIELPNRTAVWTSNENMTPDEAYRAVKELKGNQTANLLMGDGSVIVLTPEMDRTSFDALVTRQGKDNVSTQLSAPLGR